MSITRVITTRGKEENDDREVEGRRNDRVIKL